MSSYVSQDRKQFLPLSTGRLTRLAFARNYQPYLRESGVYMASALLYRGDVVHREVMEEISNIKDNRSVLFADWVPSPFKVAVSEKRPKTFDKFSEHPSTKSVCLLSNNSAYVDYL